MSGEEDVAREEDGPVGVALERLAAVQDADVLDPSPKDVDADASLEARTAREVARVDGEIVPRVLVEARAVPEADRVDADPAPKVLAKAKVVLEAARVDAEIAPKAAREADLKSVTCVVPIAKIVVKADSARARSAR